MLPVMWKKSWSWAHFTISVLRRNMDSPGYSSVQLHFCNSLTALLYSSVECNIYEKVSNASAQGGSTGAFSRLLLSLVFSRLNPSSLSSLNKKDASAPLLPLWPCCHLLVLFHSYEIIFMDSRATLWNKQNHYSRGMIGRFVTKVYPIATVK